MNPLKVIRQIRREKNIKQVDIAKKIGISQSNYAKLENGKIELTINKLISISEALSVHPIDILFPELNGIGQDKKAEKDVVEKFEKITDELINSKNKLIDELAEKSKVYRDLLEQCLSERKS